MKTYTGYELIALANFLEISEIDLWKHLDRAVATGKVEQYYNSEEAAEAGDDRNSQYAFQRISAPELLAAIPTI